MTPICSGIACSYLGEPYPALAAAVAPRERRWTAWTTPQQSMLCVGECGGFVRRLQALPSATKPARDFEHALDPLGAPRALAKLRARP